MNTHNSGLQHISQSNDNIAADVLVEQCGNFYKTMIQFVHYFGLRSTFNLNM